MKKEAGLGAEEAASPLVAMAQQCAHMVLC